MRALLGEEVGSWFAELHRGEGVELVLGHTVARDPRRAARIEAVTLDDGRRLADRSRAGRDRRAPRPRLARRLGAAARRHPDRRVRAHRASRRLRGRRRGRLLRPLPRAPRAQRALGVRRPPGRRGGERDRRAARRAPPALSSFWSDQYGMRIQYLGHAPLADARRRSTATRRARLRRALRRATASPSPPSIVGRPEGAPRAARPPQPHHRKEPSMTLVPIDRRQCLLGARRLRRHRARDLPPRRRRRGHRHRRRTS